MQHVFRFFSKTSIENAEVCRFACICATCMCHTICRITLKHNRIQSWMSQQVLARVSVSKSSLILSPLISPFVSRSCALLKAIMTNYSRLNRSRNYDELYYPSERMRERVKERRGNVLSCWNGVDWWRVFKCVCDRLIVIFYCLTFLGWVNQSWLFSQEGR